MMKTKAMVIFSMLLWGQHLATAQKMDAREMANYQTETMTEQLKLSDGQKEQVAEINLKYSEKQSELMARDGSMLSKMGDMKKMGKDKSEELEAILSEEQMEKYEDDVAPMMRKEMRKKMRT